MVNSENAPESVIMFLARFLFGITRLCSSLKECILLLDDKVNFVNKFSLHNIRFLLTQSYLFHL